MNGNDTVVSMNHYHSLPFWRHQIERQAKSCFDKLFVALPKAVMLKLSVDALTKAHIDTAKVYARKSGEKK